MGQRRSAALLVAAIGLFGACGTGDDGSPRSHDEAAATTVPELATTSTSAPVSTTAIAAPSAQTRVTTATTARANPATTAPASAAVAARAGWAPAAPGVYRYDTTGSTSSFLGKKTFPAVTTLTVDAPSGTRQHSVRALKSPDGEGFVIDQILDYQGAGVAVVRQRLALTMAGTETVRTLNAVVPTVVIPFGAGPGAHREFDLTGEGIAGHEVVDLVQTATMVVGGQPLTATLVRTVLTVSGSVTGTIQLDQWWTPSVRVPVKEHVTGTIKSGMATVKTTYDASLQRLTPG